MTPLAIPLSCALLLVAAPMTRQQETAATAPAKKAPVGKQVAPAKPAAAPVKPADDAISKIDVRVTTTTPGSVIVDRGSADGIMRGDRVVLHPKDGTTIEGFVDQPLERISRVELADAAIKVAAGTRGEILIAKVRLRKPTATVKPKSATRPLDDAAGAKKRSSTMKAPLTAPADVKPAGGKAAGAGSATAKPAATSKADPAKKKPVAKGGKPAAAKPAAVKPAAAMPTAAKPTGAAPSAAEPAGAKPATAKTGTTKTATSKTATKKTGTSKTGTSKTATTKAGAKPGQEKPAAPGSKPAAKKPTAKKPANSDPKASAEAAEHSPWKTQDEGWSQDKPLLSQLKPLRPEERSTRFQGRAWVLFDTNQFDEAEGSNTVFRTGTIFDIENPFDEGGALHFDAEVNHFESGSDGQELHFLTRRMSYSKGGTRFDANRFEVGRFLQYGIPELGYLDGVEWDHRQSDGDRFGASVGYMPEPDEDFHTFHDLQFAAWYQWAADESERLTIAGALQKTYHDGGSDRDLMIVKGRYLPGDGWDFHCATWVDHYGAGDDAKDQSIEITQAVWSLGKRYTDGDWWDLTYRKISFPDIDRNGEFDPLTAAEIEDNRLNRLMLSGSTWWSKNTRLHASVGAWDDEDESGGAGDAGIDFPGFFIRDSRMDLTAFGTKGQFTTVAGGRIAWTGNASNGSWNVFYEISNQHNDGFTLDLQDLLQHRFFVTRSLYFTPGWMISATGGGLLIDGDLAWSVGLFAQKSF